MTFEEAAAASKAAWDLGDTESAAEGFREAAELVKETHTVVQLGDGTLQLVPKT